MAEKKEIKEVDRLFREFLLRSMPCLTGKHKKAVLKHLNKQFRKVSDGKARNLVHRAEEEFGVSLAEQFKAIELAERSSWGVRISGKK